MLVFICTQYALSCSDGKKMHWHLGDPLPASYPWEPNSEALASLTSAQWNPCSHAYFGCINMFVISPWKRFLTPTLQVCDLWFCLPLASVSPLPGGRAGSMTQLREMIQNVAVRSVTFQKSLSVCSSYAGCNLWLPSPETVEQVWTLGSQNHGIEWA